MKPQHPRPPCRDSKETAKLAGYKSMSAFYNAVHEGKFPPASFSVPATRGPRHYWNLDVIEGELKRRKAAEKYKTLGVTHLTPRFTCYELTEKEKL